MKLKLLANSSMKTGIARLEYEASQFNRHPGTHIIFLVCHRAYALTLSNAGLMESIRKNVIAEKHIADGVEVLAFRNENEARAAAQTI